MIQYTCFQKILECLTLSAHGNDMTCYYIYFEALGFTLFTTIVIFFLSHILDMNLELYVCALLTAAAAIHQVYFLCQQVCHIFELKIKFM